MKRRMLSLALAFVLLVGCSPVVSNNDLSFTAYDPAPYYDSVGYDAVEEAVADRVLDYDSYNIGGTEAFYTLPYHGNNPNDVFQVDVLDYTDDGYIVYGYMAYYYGNAIGNGYSEDANGLTCSPTGTAPDAMDKSEDMVSGGTGWYDPTHVVGVLMGFNPETREYVVYHTGLESRSVISVSASSEDDEDAYAVYTIENGLYTQSIQGGKYYFICYENMGYIYSAESAQLYYSVDYWNLLTTCLDAEGIYTTNKEVEISEIVLDESCFAYVTVTITDETEVDEDADDEEVDEPEVEYYLLNCYYLPLETDEDKIYDPDDDGAAVYRSEILNLSSIQNSLIDFSEASEASPYSSLYSAEMFIAMKFAALVPLYEDYHYLNLDMQGVSLSESFETAYQFYYVYHLSDDQKDEIYLLAWKNAYQLLQDICVVMGESLSTSEAQIALNVYSGSPSYDEIEKAVMSDTSIGDGYDYSMDDYLMDVHGITSDELQAMIDECDQLFENYENGEAATNILVWDLADYGIKYGTQGTTWEKYLEPIDFIIAGISDLGLEDDFLETIHSYIYHPASVGSIYLTYTPYISYTYARDKTTYRSEYVSTKYHTENITYYSLSPNGAGVAAAYGEDSPHYMLYNLNNDTILDFTAPYNTDRTYMTMDIFDQVATATDTLTYPVYYNVYSIKYVGDPEDDDASSDSSDNDGGDTVSEADIEKAYEYFETNRDYIYSASILEEVLNWYTGTTDAWEVWTETESLDMSYTVDTAYALDPNEENYPSGGVYVSMAELQNSSSYVIPSEELGVYCYVTETESGDSDDYPDGRSHISYNDGDNSCLYSYVLGTAMDAAVFYDDDGGDMVAFMTSLGVQFYHRDAKGMSYTKGDFVYTAEFTPNADNVYSLPDAQTEEDTETYGGEASAFSSLSQLTLLGSDDMLVSTLTEGILLYDMGSGLFVGLVDDGAYYRTIKDSRSDGDYLLIGFDTEDYTYISTDMIWAKCYTMDMVSAASDAQEQIVMDYLDAVANLYHQYTHLVVQNSDGSVTAVSPSTTQSEYVTRGANLFIGDDTTYVSTLSSIAKTVGITLTSAPDLVAYALELRETVRDQYAAVVELFKMVGINRTARDSSNGEHLLVEGKMLYADYTNNLEELLVELLVTEYLDGLDTNDFIKYGTTGTGYLSYKNNLISIFEALDLEPMGLQSDGSYDDTEYVRLLFKYGVAYDADASYSTTYGDVDFSVYLSATEIQAYYDTVADGVTDDDITDGYDSLDESTAYRYMLDLVEAFYAHNTQGTIDGEVEFDDYLLDMLNRVSPDNASAAAYEAIDSLLELMGLSSSDLDIEDFYEDVKSITSVSDLEMYMMEYLMNATQYQGSTKVTDWNTYLATEFSSNELKEAAFYLGSFYEAIEAREIIYNASEAAEDESWLDLLTSLLLAINSGFVYLTDEQLESYMNMVD